jgi:pSer/pThr/pTyr-binding forkhead associated (FHA) protein
LRLQLPSGILLDLNGRQSAVIGRKDGAARPDIDLAPHRGAELGVSREHAMIVLEQGRYYVKDLDSTNNTFLNAGRLFPDQLYPLKQNDHLTLGELEMRVVLQSGT